MLWRGEERVNKQLGGGVAVSRRGSHGKRFKISGRGASDGKGWKRRGPENEAKTGSAWANHPHSTRAKMVGKTAGGSNAKKKRCAESRKDLKKGERWPALPTCPSHGQTAPGCPRL